MSENPVRIVMASDAEEIAAARELFGEYATSLGWDGTGGWMTEELATLPGTYAPPRGALLLAYVDGEPAGAVGLQPVPEGARVAGTGAESAGELKRMYVRPSFRQHGVGRAIARRAEDEARRIGYDSLVLTTSPEAFPLAQGLYESLGYRETAPYRDDMPYPHIRWMRLAL
jgi:putative acetyltransferase